MAGATNSNTIDDLLLDVISRQYGFGGMYTSTYNVFRGLNTLGGLPSVPRNMDNQGMVFFTKPCLNLSQDNVNMVRKLSFLTDYSEDGMPNIIRCMLMPPDHLVGGGFSSKGATRSKIIDDLNPFMPITNLLDTMSSPPDLNADNYITSEGYLREQTGHIDNGPGILHSYDLTHSYVNMEGDPISTLFDVWVSYPQYVKIGLMRAFPINMVENRYENQTRIIKLTLDKTRRFIQKIFVTIGYPYTVPLGGVHGFKRSEHLNQENNQIQIAFKCFGAYYNDPILLKEFNALVASWNPDMSYDKDTWEVTGNSVKVDGIAPNKIPWRLLLNNRLYPHISRNNELEWYANQDDYNAVKAFVTNEMSSKLQTNSKIILPNLIK